MAVADLNGDGLPIIVVANRYGHNPNGANYVCLNKGGGKFDMDCTAFSRESATTITPADFNGDGFVDLAVPHRDGGQSYVYLNDGKANFPRRIPFGPPDATIRMVVAADLTGNRRLDIVAIDEVKRRTSIYFNRPDGTFSAGVSGQGPGDSYALAVGDLNPSLEADIVVGYMKSPSVVYFNNGPAHLPRQFNLEMARAGVRNLNRRSRQRWLARHRGRAIRGTQRCLFQLGSAGRV